MNTFQVIVIFMTSIILSVIASIIITKKVVNYVLLDTVTKFYEALNTQFNILSESILHVYERVYDEEDTDTE